MLFHKLFALLLVSIVSTYSVAGKFDELFEKHFFSRYEPRQCGANALNFVKGVKQSLGDVEPLYVVTIVNKGISVFGMVNAEKARGQRFKRPSEEEANWYHHVFVLDDSGLVYDFDFGTTPRTIAIEEYLEEMFLNEPECDNPRYGEFCAGRATKLKDYEFSSISANEAIGGQAERIKVGRMSAVARNWDVLVK